MLDRLYIPVERLKLHRNAFEELERAAVNAEVHFGDALAHHLREPLRVYQRIVVATVCRMSNVGLSQEAKVSRALVRQWEAVVHASVTALDDTDELSLEMDEGLLTAETMKARRGDSRTLEEAGVHCSKCGSRRFTATRFTTRSTAYAFMRNI